MTDSKKQIVSGLILAVCIIVMALDLKAISLEMTAIVGALVCVLTGCLTEKQAYSAIDWVTIFLYNFQVSVQFCFRKQILTDKHHVSDNHKGQRKLRLL